MYNYEQLTFQGDTFKTIENYARRVQEYERQKELKKNTCLTYAELEKELRKLAEELGL